MEPRLSPLAELFHLNTRLFLNCLDDVDDDTGLVRVTPASNNMTFVAVHLLDARAFLTGCLGGDGTHPFKEMLAEVNSIEEADELPKLGEIRAAWREASGRLVASLGDMSTAELDAEAPHRFPITDPSVLGMTAFLVQHESYHIGQMAILRKQLGLEAMAYHQRDDP